MTTQNEIPKPSDNMEALRQEASACGAGCGCHAGGPTGRTRWIVGVIVLVAAGLLVARAMVKNNGASADTASVGFAALAAPEKTSAPAVGSAPATNETPAAADTITVKELGELSELNAVAADTVGVFVFLSGKNEPTVKAPLTQMRSAARTIEAKGQKIGIFTLKTGSRDYEQIAAQTAVPVVLAMVKGRGMIPVSGDITETKLIQGFVAASNAGGGGCGPSGCGPSGCN